MIHISEAVTEKLKKKHRVALREVYECFANFADSHVMLDEREDHRTDPPTEWFIAETDTGRRLKIVYILDFDETIVVKTAYEPNRHEERAYAAGQ